MNFETLEPEGFESFATELTNDGAGWQISGSSGSGKSETMEYMFMKLIRRNGRQAVFFDPHGNSAKSLWRKVQSLPARIRDNVLYIRPSDLRTVVGINPLFIPRDNLTEYEWLARLSNKVSHTAMILLSVFGESAFGSRPVLRKWVTRWLRTLAYVGLSIADVRYFIDVRSELYQELVKSVPDLLSRNEMSELPRLRPHELENEIASAKNRFLGMLENPVCESVLGRLKDCLDMHQVIADGTSIILDLEPAGMLSPDDQQLLCNLYLSEFLHAVVNMPEEQRRPCCCFIDELPVFQSSQNLLLNMMCEIRKFKTKFIVAHQGSSRFPGGHENEFLRTIIAQCRVHLYMRHSAHDAMFFGNEVSLPTYDPHIVKHEQWNEVQKNDGVDVIELNSHSKSGGTTDTEGESETDGTTEASTWGTQEGESNAWSDSEQKQLDSLRTAVTQATTSGTNRSYREGGSESTTRQKGMSRSKANSASWSTSVNQTTIPRFRIEDVLQSVTFYSPEEQTRLIAQRIAGFAPGQGFLSIGGKGTWIVQIPLVVDGLARAPRARAKKLAGATTRLLARPEFTTPEQIQCERQQTLSALLQQVRGILRDSLQPPQSRLNTVTSNAVTSIETPDAETLDVHEILPPGQETTDAPWNI